MSHRRRRTSPARDRLGFEQCEVRWTLAADLGGEGGLVELRPTYQPGSLQVGFVVLPRLGMTAASTASITSADVMEAVAIEMPVLDGMRGATMAANESPGWDSYSSWGDLGWAGSSVVDLAGSDEVRLLQGESPGAWISVVERVLGSDFSDHRSSVLGNSVGNTLSSKKNVSAASPPRVQASTEESESSPASRIPSSSASSRPAQRNQMLAAALEGLGQDEPARLQPLPSPTRDVGPLIAAAGTHPAGFEGGAIDVHVAMSVRPEAPSRRDVTAAVWSNVAIESGRQPGLAGVPGNATRRAELARAVVVSSARSDSAGGEYDARSSATALESRLIEAGALGPSAAVADQPKPADPAPSAGETVVNLSRWSLSATAMAALVWAASRLQPLKEPPGGRSRSDREGDLGDGPAVRRPPRRFA